MSRATSSSTMLLEQEQSHACEEILTLAERQAVELALPAFALVFPGSTMPETFLFEPRRKRGRALMIFVGGCSMRLIFWRSTEPQSGMRRRLSASRAADRDHHGGARSPARRGLRAASSGRRDVGRLRVWLRSPRREPFGLAGDRDPAQGSGRLSSQYDDGLRRTARGSQIGGHVDFPRVASSAHRGRLTSKGVCASYPRSSLARCSEWPSSRLPSWVFLLFRRRTERNKRSSKRSSSRR
jgi:hypothetical protein